MSQAKSSSPYLGDVNALFSKRGYGCPWWPFCAGTCEEQKDQSMGALLLHYFLNINSLFGQFLLGTKS